MKCSCCGEFNAQARSHLISKISYLLENKLPWYAWPHDLHKNIKFNPDGQILSDLLTGFAMTSPNLATLFSDNHFQWACDNCIESGRAIVADISRQKFSTHPPYLAYYDKELVCGSCSKSFIYSKQEQKYWYEDLNFWVQCIPRNCLECRKEKRKISEINQQLQTLLRSLNMNDNEQLRNISSLYMELGNITKAKHYNSLGSKTKD